MAHTISTYLVGLLVAVCLLGKEGVVAKHMRASLADASAQARTVR
jgi:hypothetical protein